jgi:8-oxo-dGTP diphosphatase
MEIVLQALIANPEGRILMVQRPVGKWQFVGGRVNAGENWLEALRREVHEETAITELEIISVMTVDNWLWEGVPEFGVYFFCRTNVSEVTLSDEHLGCRWLSGQDDLTGIDFFHPSLEILLRRALAGDVGFQPLVY